MITPITIVSAISTVLIASLFTHRKLDVLWCGLSAFAGVSLAAPSITMSPPVYLGGYDMFQFLNYDLAFIIGISGGLVAAILLSVRHEKAPSIWMVLVSFLCSGFISILYFVGYELWRFS